MSSMFIVAEFWGLIFSGTTVRVEFCWRSEYIDSRGRRFYRCVFCRLLKVDVVVFPRIENMKTLNDI